MCGRYTLTKKNPSEFIDQFGPFEGLEKASFNRAPGQAQPVVIKRENQFSWTSIQWGEYQRKNGHETGFFPINARSETIGEKAIFASSFRERRCLIPADGWFEWQKIESQKYPFFHRLPNFLPFAIAGIWKPKEKRRESAFSILTTSAPSNLSHIHSRVPVILHQKIWNHWMDPESSEPELQEILKLKPPEISAYQVNSSVNSSRNDGPDLLLPGSGKQALLF